MVVQLDESNNCLKADSTAEIGIDPDILCIQVSSNQMSHFVLL